MAGQLRTTTGRNRATPSVHGAPYLRLGRLRGTSMTPQGFQVTTAPDGTGSGALPVKAPASPLHATHWQLWLAAAVGAYFFLPKYFK